MAQCTHELRMIDTLFCASQVVTYAKLHKMLHLLTSSERHAGIQPADTWPAIRVRAALCGGGCTRAVLNICPLRAAQLIKAPCAEHVSLGAATSALPGDWLFQAAAQFWEVQRGEESVPSSWLVPLKLCSSP